MGWQLWTAFGIFLGFAYVYPILSGHLADRQCERGSQGCRTHCMETPARLRFHPCRPPCDPDFLLPRVTSMAHEEGSIRESIHLFQETTTYRGYRCQGYVLCPCPTRRREPSHSGKDLLLSVDRVVHDSPSPTRYFGSFHCHVGSTNVWYQHYRLLLEHDLPQVRLHCIPGFVRISRFRGCQLCVRIPSCLYH